MFKAAFKLMKRNICANAFVCLQLIVTLVLAIICVSSVLSKIEYYLPLRNLLSSDGVCAFTGSALFESFDFEEVENSSDNIDNVYGSAACELYASNDSNNTCVYAYNDNMISLYTPSMSSGKWDDIAKGNGIISSYTDKYHVGDTITLYDDKGARLSFPIVGILAENEKVINTSAISNEIYDFNDLYEETNGTKLYISTSCADKNEISYNPSGVMFVSYKDGLTDNEKSELHRTLYTFSGNLIGLNDELNVNSLSYIRSDILLILPVCICILVLAIISSAAAAVIQTKSSLRTYSIFYVCGSKWSQCLQISLINNTVICVISLAISMLAAKIINESKLFNVICDLDLWQIAICIVILIISIVFSICLPIGILAGSTAGDILKEESK
ncbi:MAG: hypothetical protein LUI06_09500 [Ruminococcus sp.]|nr:hypothetical protein [Ruminococcus sp.]